MGIYMWRDAQFATQWPCPNEFHVPLISEWTTIDGILRYTFGLWLDRDYTTECLKMPYAGQRQNDTSNTRFQGSLGYYRCADSSKAYETDEDARPRVYWHVSAMGLSIRPFKNAPVTPDSSRTVLYQWTWSAGVYHNSTLWLISISGDGTTRYTIADKNLWATQVWNNWDTPSEANCGKYYQRWNNYWFPRSWSVTTSSTQVDASSYWPWNYYSSSTFIIGSWRDSSGNWNLWWWVDGNVPV